MDAHAAEAVGDHPEHLVAGVVSGPVLPIE
jgi:hypothetical protein